MLDANYLDGLPDELVKLFAKAERTILADMARRIKKYDCWLPSVEHQKRMLQLAGVMQEEIFTALSKLTGKTDAELKRLMLQAAKRMEQDGAAAYAAAGRQAPPFEKSENLRKILQSGYKNLQSEFKNICRTTAVAAARQFTEATDLAWMQVHSGAMSYDAAIRQACKGLAKEGLAAVQYPSGHKDTIETAVRRAVVTGVNHTCCDLALEEAKELGLDLVEVSAHEGARPEHALWQGKVYSISGKSEKYPSFYDVTGYGSGRGLGGWNCRHSFAPYVEGEPRVWSDEALEKLKEPVCEYQGQKLTEYEASQIQRRNERQIRRWKREYTTMEAAGQDTTKAATKIKKWQAEQENFLKETGRKRQYSRENVVAIQKKSSIIKSGSDFVTIQSIDSPIEQRHTGKGNPNAILHFDVALNNRQQTILNALPDYNSRTTVQKSDVSMRDLAAFTAKTGDEFALFTKEGKRVVVRGNSFMVEISTEEAYEMGKQGYTWSGHTHPGIDFNSLQPSDGDYAILNCFNQESSAIYNSTGEYLIFERTEPYV